MRSVQDLLHLFVRQIAGQLLDVVDQRLVLLLTPFIGRQLLLLEHLVHVLDQLCLEVIDLRGRELGEQRRELLGQAHHRGVEQAVVLELQRQRPLLRGAMLDRVAHAAHQVQPARQVLAPHAVDLFVDRGTHQLALLAGQIDVDVDLPRDVPARDLGGGGRAAAQSEQQERQACEVVSHALCRLDTRAGCRAGARSSPEAKSHSLQ